MEAAIGYLREANSGDYQADTEMLPWLALLTVKWVCQDVLFDTKSGLKIRKSEFQEIVRDALSLSSGIPEKAEGGANLPLFMRRATNPQLFFQRDMRGGYLRDAVIIKTLCADSDPLLESFRTATGFGLEEFIDISLGTSTIVINGSNAFRREGLAPLESHYRPEAIEAFLESVSLTTPALIEYCRSLKKKTKNVESELFEAPVLSRYPLHNIGETYYVWHPAVWYRGMEGFVQSVLHSLGDKAWGRYTRLFESYCVRILRASGLEFRDEKQIAELLPRDAKKTDGVLAFENCNVLIECKAGVFAEDGMATGSAEILAHKIRALRNAILQGQSVCESLSEVDGVGKSVNYLLVVTNKEVAASNGRSLQEMVGESRLPDGTATGSRLLPLEHVYFLFVDDLERLLIASEHGVLHIPRFLAQIVEDDTDHATAKFFFDQHLNAGGCKRYESQFLVEARAKSFERLKSALENDG